MKNITTQILDGNLEIRCDRKLCHNKKFCNVEDVWVVLRYDDRGIIGLDIPIIILYKDYDITVEHEQHAVIINFRELKDEQVDCVSFYDDIIFDMIDKKVVRIEIIFGNV